MQFMRAQEVIICDPEGKIIAGAVIAVKAVCGTVRSFVSVL